MYKLFINNKTVFLCQNPALVENVINGNFIIEAYTTRENFASTLKIMLNNANPNSFILFNKDVENMFEEVCSYFKCIEAAGGVVKNFKNEILLIHRRGFWDLPKGKIEKRETIKDAAIREVKEETGIKNVEIKKIIKYNNFLNQATYHSYEEDERLCLKVSYWFEMKTDFKGILVPQAEEDIEKAIWVRKEDIPNHFDNMYPSIIDVLNEVI